MKISTPTKPTKLKYFQESGTYYSRRTCKLAYFK